MGRERRQSSRINENVHVEFYEEHIDHAQRTHLHGIAKNSGFGGMFIVTDNPPAQGSFVRLQFQIASEDASSRMIEAQGMVSWVRNSTKPLGMGVKFVKFEGIGEQEFMHWLTSLSE